MYDIDMFMSSTAVIGKLHADGRVVICYFSAGSYEPGRPDSAMLASTGLGSVLDGWPDERWVDIRSAAVRDVMRGRLNFAVSQGCDGVEPDNVDAFDNENGLGLTAQDQVDYNLFLAREAHSRGLSIGLKNTLGLVPNLVSSFDWALNEECLQFGECASLQPFITAGKAVFHCEYTENTGADAETATGVGLDTDADNTDAADTDAADADGADTDADNADADDTAADTDAADTDADPGTQAEQDDTDAADTDADPEEDPDSDPDAEYAIIGATTDASQVCANRPVGFSTIIKNLDLDAYRLSCD
jgi:Glycoside-hydrolase family GH114